MALEVELKLTINDADSRPSHEDLVACWQPLLAVAPVVEAPKSLLNAYFETPDQWFRRHDCGLRTRLKAGRYEQTIKLAGQQQGAAHIRPEYNVPCDSVWPVLANFPAEIWPADTQVEVLQAQLQEMFRTDFIRQAYQLMLPDGSQVEAVLDSGAVMAGGASSAICEIELELVAGEPACLFALARALLAQFDLSVGFQSKAERGYRLAQQQPLQWLEPENSATLGQWLRAVSQNLFLQQQAPSLAQSQALIALWQRFVQALEPHALPVDLLAQAHQLDLGNHRACQLWLLDFTQWLVQE